MGLLVERMQLLSHVHRLVYALNLMLIAFDARQLKSFNRMARREFAG